MVHDVMLGAAIEVGFRRRPADLLHGGQNASHRRFLSRWFGTSVFNCGSCGADQWYIEHRYIRIERYLQILQCSCGSTGVAVRRRKKRICRCQRTGYLDEIGFEPEGSAQEELSDEEIEQEVLCPACAKHTDWRRSRDTEPETHLDDHEFEISCGGCARMIEIDWRELAGLLDKV